MLLKPGTSCGAYIYVLPSRTDWEGKHLALSAILCSLQCTQWVCVKRGRGCNCGFGFIAASTIAICTKDPSHRLKRYFKVRHITKTDKRYEHEAATRCKLACELSSNCPPQSISDGKATSLKMLWGLLLSAISEQKFSYSALLLKAGRRSLKMLLEHLGEHTRLLVK